eukprot:348574-Pelagomonas_calceolata.AAC.1
MRGLTPVHALQHSWTPRTLQFQMPGIPSTISTVVTGFPLNPHMGATVNHKTPALLQLITSPT